MKILAEADAETFKIGVTDLLFNPVIEVYKRSLRSSSGKRTTPAYWLQELTKETEDEFNDLDFKQVF